MLFQFGLFLTALLILIVLLAIISLVYDWVAKQLESKPEMPILKPQNKPSDTFAQPAVKKPLNLRFEVEIKGSNKVKELTSENFKELLSEYFIAVNYLHQLWLEHPFNITITDDLIRHYGKNKALNGFIRYRQIPEIYIITSSTSKHKTAVLIHEIAHQRAEQEAKLKNVRIASHGPQFKRHMRLLFAPLLVDRTHYKKNEELSYQLTYEATRFSPTKDLCI